MAGEAVRRLVLVAGTWLLVGTWVFSVLQVKLHVGLRTLPLLLLAFVGLLSDLESSTVGGNVYAQRIGAGMGLSALSAVVGEALKDGFLPSLVFGVVARLLISSAFAVGTSAEVRARHGTSGLWLSRFATVFWSSLLVLVFAALTLPRAEDADYLRRTVPVQVYIATIGVTTYRAVARYAPGCGRESYLYSALGATLSAAAEFGFLAARFGGAPSEAVLAAEVANIAAHVALSSSTILPPRHVQLASGAAARPQPLKNRASPAGVGGDSRPGVPAGTGTQTARKSRKSRGARRRRG